jgi:hypothetical protein
MKRKIPEIIKHLQVCPSRVMQPITEMLSPGATLALPRRPLRECIGYLIDKAILHPSIRYSVPVEYSINRTRFAMRYINYVACLFSPGTRYYYSPLASLSNIILFIQLPLWLIPFSTNPFSLLLFVYLFYSINHLFPRPTPPSQHTPPLP